LLVDNDLGHDTRSQQNQPPLRRRGRPIVSLVALVLLLAAAAAGWLWFERLRGTTAAVAPAAQPPQVTVAKPVVKNIVEWDDFTGRFEAMEDVAIRSRVTGYLEQVHFQDGALIQKGDLLFTIDPRSFDAALRELRARSEVAKTALELAEREFERASSLQPSGAIAQATFEQRRQEFLAAQAEMAAAEAAFQQAQLNVDYTRIEAPISGRIGRRFISVGNLVNANDTVLSTIVALNPIYFYFDVDERSYIAYSRSALQGKGPSSREIPFEVRMFIPGDHKENRTGTMNFVDNRVDAATGTVRGRALFANSDLFLQPGMFGRVSIPGSGSYQAVLIPDEAIGSDQDRRIVYVVGEDGTVAAQPIRPGPKIDGYRVVRDGLTGDETIAVAGLMRIRPGMKVTPQTMTLPPVAAAVQQAAE
jgi:RND family efflux transporter MFP subunit